MNALRLECSMFLGWGPMFIRQLLHVVYGGGGTLSRNQQKKQQQQTFNSNIGWICHIENRLQYNPFFPVEYDIAAS